MAEPHEQAYNEDEHWAAERAEEGHEHLWGEVEYATFTGNPHRKCQVDECKFITDLDEDEDESEPDPDRMLEDYHWNLSSLYKENP